MRDRTSIGGLDQALGSGHEYDMWLKLRASAPALFIPTAIQTPPEQVDAQVHERMFFDAGKAAVNFINAHGFREMFPLLDLSENGKAKRAFEATLDVAADASGILYALGPHPGLLLRLVECIGVVKSPEIAHLLKALFLARTNKVIAEQGKSHFARIWEIAAAALQAECHFVYTPVVVADIAEAHYWRLRRVDAHKAERLREWLIESEYIKVDESRVESKASERGVLFVAQKGYKLDDKVLYGTHRAMSELARAFSRRGDVVLVAGLHANGLNTMTFCNGVLTLLCADDLVLWRISRKLGAFDTAIGISRADFIINVTAVTYRVYHHGPHPVQGLKECEWLLNLLRIPVVCVSEYSRKQQIGFGIDGRNISVIPNGYNHELFYCTPQHQERMKHSLVYAGNIAAYKGTDIALQAFRIIRESFPEAEMSIFGKPHMDDLHNGWFDHEGFLSEEGSVRWDLVERAFPGVRYHGEVCSEELADAYRRHSLLIMPSRMAETFGIVSLEAQACGCIPVLPRSGGFIETVDENRSGYLYDSNTAEGLAAKIVELWTSGLPSELTREYAEKWVASNFGWDKTSDEFISKCDTAELFTRLPEYCYSFRRLGIKLGWKLSNVVRRYGRRVSLWN